MIRVNLMPSTVLRARRTAVIALAVRKVFVWLVAAVFALGLAGFAVYEFAMFIAREPAAPAARREDTRISPWTKRGFVPVVRSDASSVMARPALAVTRPPAAPSVEMSVVPALPLDAGGEAPATANEAPPAVPSGPRPFTPEVATLQPGELIWLAAEHFQVPACLLWAIWMKETSLLLSNWRDDRADWFRGVEIIEEGGQCIKRYSVEKCAKHWRALVSLCKQERNGAPICNPEEVYTSYALAVGPMQHMPGELVEPCADNSDENCFTENAQDFDADEVVNPWLLPDAMAMTALKLHRYYERGGRSWRWAANRYYGSQNGGYYDGVERRKGVKQFWQDCCRESGSCRAPTSRD